MLHWIKGRLYANNQGPDSRDEPFEQFSRQTDRHCGLSRCSMQQKGSPRRRLLLKIKGLYQEISEIYYYIKEIMTDQPTDQPTKNAHREVPLPIKICICIYV